MEDPFRSVALSLGRPWQRALAVFQEWNPGGDFAELLAAYVRTGFVYSGDDAFVLATPMGSPADTWFVHLAVGDLRRIARLVPYALRFVAFQRRGGGSLKRYTWAKFAAHLRL